jgi:hypothetical protein
MHNVGRITAWVALLPYIEQGNMFDRIQAGDPTANPPIGRGGPRGDHNWVVWNTPPAVLRCPSEVNGLKAPRGNNYVVCAGDQVANVNTRTDTRGVFGRTIWRRLAEITDGTSNTIALSEVIIHVPVGAGGQFGSTATANEARITLTLANLVPGLVNSPAICRTVTNGKFFVAGTNVRSRRGIQWTDAPAVLSMFTTVLPPNSPSCAEAGEWGDQDSVLLPPQSNHPSGVIGAFCDGSVRFVSDTINCGNLGVTQPQTGPSMYGVWGAMGSMSGGEASALE